MLFILNMFSVADTFEQKTGAVLRKRPQYYSDSFQGIEKSPPTGTKTSSLWAVVDYAEQSILLMEKPDVIQFD